MRGLAKTFEVKFKVGGEISPTLQKAFEFASKSMSALKNASQNNMLNTSTALERSMTTFKRIGENVARFNQLSSEAAKQQQEVAQATQKAQAMQPQLKLSQEKVDKLKEELDELKALQKIQKTLELQARNQKKLEKERGKALKVEAGVKSSKQLERRIEKAQTPEEKIKLLSYKQNLENNAKSIADLGVQNKATKKKVTDYQEQIIAKDKELRAAQKELKLATRGHEDEQVRVKAQKNGLQEIRREMQRVSRDLSAAGFSVSKISGSEKILANAAVATARAYKEHTAKQDRVREYQEKLPERLREQLRAGYEARLRESLLGVKELGLLNPEKAIKPLEVKDSGLRQWQKLKTSVSGDKVTETLELAKAYRELKGDGLRNRQAFEVVNVQTAGLARRYKEREQKIEMMRERLSEAQGFQKSAGKGINTEAGQKLALAIAEIAKQLTKAEQNLKATAANLEASKARGRTLKAAIVEQREQERQLRGRLSTAGFSVAEFGRSQKRYEEIARRAEQEARANEIAKRYELVRKSLTPRLKEAKALQEQKLSEEREYEKRVAASKVRVETLPKLQSTIESLRALSKYELVRKENEKVLSTIRAKALKVQRQIDLERMRANMENYKSQVSGIERSQEIRRITEKTAQPLRALQKTMQEVRQIGTVQAIMPLKVQDQALRQTQKLTTEIPANKLERKQRLIEIGKAYGNLGMEFRANVRSYQETRRQTGKLLKAYENQKSAMATLSARMQDLQAVQKGYGDKIPPLMNEMLKAQVMQVKGQLTQAENNLKQIGQNYETSKANSQSLRGSLQTQLTELQRLKRALNIAGFNTSEYARSMANLRAELERTTVAAANRQRFEQSYERVGQEYQNFQNAVQTAQTLMSPFVSSVENAMTYEYELTNVKALTQLKDIRLGNVEKVNAEMAELDRQFRHLGATTEYTMTEVAQGAGYLAMAGWTQKQIKAGMPVFMDLATATRTAGQEFARLMDIITDDMTAAGLKAGEMYTIKSTGRQVKAEEYFANAFTYAITNANLNKESLHEGFKYYAPIASELDLSVGEMLGTAMLVANSGIKGSQAGTGFRSGLLRVAAPPKTAAEALTKLEGYASMSDAQKEIELSQNTLAELGVQETDMFKKLMSISEKLQGFDKEQRMGYVNAIFGKTAATFWAKVLSRPENVAQIGEYVKYMESGEIDNYAADTAAVQRDNTKIQLELLKSSLDAVSNAMGTALLPAVRQTVEGVTPLMTRLSEWIALNPQVVQASAAIAASFSGIVVAGAGAKLLQSVFGLVGAGLKLIVTPLSGITTALPKALTSWQALGAAFTGFFTSIPSKVGAFARSLMNIPTAIAAVTRAGLAFAFSPFGAAALAIAATAIAIYKNWERIAPVIEHLAGVVGERLVSAYETMKPSLENAYESFSNLMEVIGESGAGDLLAKSFVVALNVIAGVFTTIADMASNIIALMGDIVGGASAIVSNIAEGNFKAAGEAFTKMVGNSTQHALNVAYAPIRGVSSIYENAQKSIDIYNRKYQRTEKVNAFSEDYAKVFEQAPSELAEKPVVFEWSLKPARDRQASRIMQIMQGTSVDSEVENGQWAEYRKVHTARELREHERQRAYETIRSQRHTGYQTNLPQYAPAYGDVELPQTIPPAPENQSLLQQATLNQITSPALNVPQYTPSFKADVKLPSSTPAPPSRFEVETRRAENSAVHYRDLGKYQWTPADVPIPRKYETTYDEVIRQANEAAARLRASQEEPKASTVETGGLISKAFGEMVEFALNPLSIFTMNRAAAATPESVQSINTDKVQMQLNGLGEATQNSAVRFESHAQAMTTNVVSNEQAFNAAQSTINATRGSFELANQSTAAFSSNVVQGSQVANASMVQAATATNTASNETQSLTSNLMMNSASVQNSTVETQNNAQAAMTSSGQLINLSSTASNSTVAINTMSGSTANASVALSGLGSAAASAINALFSAASSVGRVVTNAISSVASFVGISNNYSGGIYKQGAFLTWFAEKSPEAAIPLDGSERAIKLWQQAGNMLGVYPYEANVGFNSTPAMEIAENANGGIYAPGGARIENNGLNEAQESAKEIKANQVKIVGDYEVALGAFEHIAKATGEAAGAMENSALELEKVGKRKNFFEKGIEAFTSWGRRAVKTFDEHVLKSKPSGEVASTESGVVRQPQAPITAKSLWDDITLDVAARSQQRMQQELAIGREETFNEEVKRRKTYEAMQRGRKPGKSIVAPEDKRYGGAVSTMLRGDIGGAANQAFEVYKTNKSNRALEAAVTQTPTVTQNQAVAGNALASQSKKRNILERWGNTAVDFLRGKKSPRADKVDKLGNINNLEVPEYNRITENDDEYIKGKKYDSQVKQLEQERSARNKAMTTGLAIGAGAMILPKVAGRGLTGSVMTAVGGSLLDKALAPRSQPEPMGSGKAVIRQPGSPMTFGGVVQEMFTSGGVKAQQRNQGQLNFAREAKIGDRVKRSKSFEAMQRGRKPGKSITAPERKGYDGIVSSLLKGNIGGALVAGAEKYQSDNEIKGLEQVTGAQTPAVQSSQAQVAPKKSFMAKGFEAIGAFARHSASSLAGMFKKKPETEVEREAAEKAASNQMWKVNPQVQAMQMQTMEAQNNAGGFNSLESSTATTNEGDNSPITINLTVNIQGVNNPEEFREATDEFSSKVGKTIAEQIRELQHEQKRGAFNL